MTQQTEEKKKMEAKDNYDLSKSDIVQEAMVSDLLEKMELQQTTTFFCFLSCGNAISAESRLLDLR